ncbi:glutathione S-transferase family protein [Massilia glaciei]|uniref:Glutathione S-transferase n=1 Tax=Massilia glaciei TaxID=1524097 RepID=A0A2U2I5M6_9BURK|nr:glutathione S-transferase [Massilia glaciei]PWF55022.1 glutathione S-transferase [Massilia glaciei]
MIQVLGKPSSINVRKVLWTCVEIGEPFVQESWGSGFRSTDAAQFKALNPNAMVPVIRDGDFTLWESNTICRYLAAKHGRADLLPRDAAARAKVEQWMDWQATELNNAWRYAFMALVRQSTLHPDAHAVTASVAGWNRHMGILDDQLSKTGPYVCGPEFTLADIVLALSVNRWLMTPMTRPAYAALAAYMELLRQREGFRLHCANGSP